MQSASPLPSRGLWRHAGVVAVAIAGLTILRAARVELFVPRPLFLLALVGGAFAGAAAYQLWSTARAGWRVDARILAHVVPIGVLTYLTGWGSALVPLQLIAVAGNVKHGGYGTLPRVFAWCTAITIALEAGVHADVLTSTLATSTGHGIAAIGAAAVAFVGSEFAHADRARRAAEAEQGALSLRAAQQHMHQQQLQDELTWQANHDAVTRLPTHTGLMEAIGEVAAADTLALLRIGVEGIVADGTHGTVTRDAVLSAVAGRLRGVSGHAGGYLARVDVDEFAMLLAPVDGTQIDRAGALRVARSVTTALRPPIDLPHGRLHVTANVGISLGRASADARPHVSNAATALQAARAAGIEHVEVFDPVGHVAVADRLALAADIRGAVVNQDFDLDYQPVIELRTGRMVSAEALVRWDHPTRGRLGPDLFIPEAERSGHIAQIGRYVLEEAAWQARSWERDFGPLAPTVAVNVSARQLDDHLLAIVEEVLDDTMLAPDRLTLELTETAMAPGGAQTLRDRLNQLKELGVTLALDDFGTGYASLQYLEQLPFDVVKIDRCFVRSATTPGAPVARAMVDLARAMGLVTVIEGIESEQERAHFATLGCDRAQGYLFAPPLPAVMLSHRLRQQHRDPAPA